MEALGLVPAEGWPSGILRAAPALRMFAMVIAELPQTPETLLFRVLGGHRPVRLKAVRELERLPPAHRDREVVM